MGLVKLHAKHGLEDVKEIDAYKRLLAAHADNPGRPAALTMVRGIYEQLENALHGTPKEQVTAALSEVSGYRIYPERGEVCRQLVLRRWSRFWSKAQRAHFTDASEKLTTWNHFFLSFTTYHPSRNEVLSVNNRYVRLLDHGLQQVIRAPDTMTENLLARLINNLLEAVDMRGFYYPKHRDERPVEQKLIDEASKSITFIQILQSSMFNREPNFCRMEFDAAMDAEPARLVVVMGEPRPTFVDRYLVAHPLRSWYDVVIGQETFQLGPMRRQEQVEAEYDRLEAHVVQQVQDALKSLFAAIPD